MDNKQPSAEGLDIGNTRAEVKNDQPIIVGLDIGTTKIAVIAGRKNEFGKLEILGFGKSNSNGVKHGQVLNIDETIKAIKSALENCFASNPLANLSRFNTPFGYKCLAPALDKYVQGGCAIIRSQSQFNISNIFP